MEDCFVAAQQGRLTLRQAHIDLLLGATDLLARIAHTAEAEIGQWEGEKKADVDACLASLAGILAEDEIGPAGDGPAAPRPAPLRRRPAMPPSRDLPARLATAAPRTGCCASRRKTSIAC